MPVLLEQKPVSFADRRQTDDGRPGGGSERRQFRDAHQYANPSHFIAQGAYSAKQSGQPDYHFARPQRHVENR